MESTKLHPVNRMTAPCPPSGVYPDMPAEEYHAIDALNASTLKEFAKSGKHGEHYLMGSPIEPTAAMLFGSALHTAILEPDEYRSSKFACEEIGPSAEVKHRKVQEEHPDKIILRKGWESQIVRMAVSINSHPSARDLISCKGTNEVTLIWRITRMIDGNPVEIPCKARLDRFVPSYQLSPQNHPGPCVVDLKTTKDATPDGFSRAIGNFNYHIQFAWYALGAYETGLVNDPAHTEYIVIAAEKSAPYAVATYRINGGTMEQGQRDFMAAMSRYIQYRLLGHATHQSESLIPVGLPVWAMHSENQTS